MTTNRSAEDAFYESEAALRLVDRELHEFREVNVPGEHAVEQLLALLARVREERATTNDHVPLAFLGHLESRLADVIALFDPAG